MRHNTRAFSLATILFIFLGCASSDTRPRRQWLEGDILHYDNGHTYQDAVSIALPHYHIDGGKYVPTNEESGTHFHLSLNEKGPAGQYVRCFATKRADGTWEHKPQWYENDPKYRNRDGYGR